LKYDEENKLLILQGISIVNGAQTTGAIGSLDSAPSSNVNVQARFIVCSSTETIQSIIRYNNS
jgi:AIPR protein